MGLRGMSGKNNQDKKVAATLHSQEPLIEFYPIPSTA